jgi:hypothetical protein
MGLPGGPSSRARRLATRKDGMSARPHALIEASARAVRQKSPRRTAVLLPTADACAFKRPPDTKRRGRLHATEFLIVVAKNALDITAHDSVSATARCGEKGLIKAALEQDLEAIARQPLLCATRQNECAIAAPKGPRALCPCAVTRLPGLVINPRVTRAYCLRVAEGVTIPRGGQQQHCGHGNGESGVPNELGEGDGVAGPLLPLGHRDLLPHHEMTEPTSAASRTPTTVTMRPLGSVSGCACQSLGSMLHRLVASVPSCPRMLAARTTHKAATASRAPIRRHHDRADCSAGVSFTLQLCHDHRVGSPGGSGHWQGDGTLPPRGRPYFIACCPHRGLLYSRQRRDHLAWDHHDGQRARRCDEGRQAVQWRT